MCRRGRQSHLGGSSSILQHLPLFLAAPPIKIPYGSSPPSFRPRALSARRKPLLLLLLLPPLGKTRRNFHSRSKPSPQVVTYEVYGRKKKAKAGSFARCLRVLRLRLRLRRTKNISPPSSLGRSPLFFRERTEDGRASDVAFFGPPPSCSYKSPPPSSLGSGAAAAAAQRRRRMRGHWPGEGRGSVT